MRDPDRHRCRLAPHFVFAVAALIASSASAAPKRIERWFRVSMNGTPIGSAYEEETRGVERVTVRSVQLVRLQRAGDSVEMQEDITYVESLAGAPISFVRVSRVSNQRGETTSGEVRGDTVHVVTGGDDRRETQVVTGAKGLRFPYGQRLLAREKGWKAGTRYNSVWFIPELKSLDHATVVVGKARRSEISGARVLLVPVDITLKNLPIKMREWVDTAGEPLRLETEVGGFRVVAERVLTKAAAESRAGASVDILEMTQVRADRPISSPREVRRAVYRVRAASGAVPDAEWTGPGQAATKTESGALKLVVTSLERGADAPYAPPETYLQPTSVAQSDEAAIRTTAAHIALGESDPWKRLKRVEAWVHHALSKKSYRVTFASAKEVLETREGDCTEHAVLVVALLRALGVPARGVFGLVYVGGSFGYHMWAEAHLAGKWVPLDATLWAPVVDATHIRMGSSDLKSPLADFARILPVVASGLRIEVVDISR